MVASNIVSQIRTEYIQGTGSIHELADKYGQPYRALEVRGSKEKWKDKRESFLKKIEDKSMKSSENEAELWLKEVRKTSKEEWNYITDSIKGLVISGQGIDADNIATYARARKTYDDMIRRSLGLSDQVSVDVTSKGKSLGESMADALLKLREQPLDDYKPLTKEQLDIVIEAEIIPD